MGSIIYQFSIPEIPDCTHYKYVTTYEGSVTEHVFQRAEHLLRMIANFHPEEITIAIRFFYNPSSAGKPQDRMRLGLGVKTTNEISSTLVNQVIRHGPLAEFYNIEESDNCLKDWDAFHAVSEIIRFEESLKPSSPPGLDIHKLNDLIPEVYYCIHPFKARVDNDFLMLDKTCSSLKEPVLLEIMVQPTSRHDELDLQYREIVRLMAVNSYSRDEYIVDSSQLDPFKDLYEPKSLGEREIRARDPMADEFLRAHREFQRILRKPQLLFNVKAWAQRPETAHLIAYTAAECAFEEGTYLLMDYEKNSEWFEPSVRASKDLTPFSKSSCCRDIWSSYNNKGPLRLGHMTSVDEFKGMFRLPVAGYSPLCCLWKSTDYYRKMDTQDGLLVGHVQNMSDEPKFKEITPGPLLKYLHTSSLNVSPVNIPVNLLTKHMFIAGVPGSGKTTAIFNLLIQLFERGIPFLVIEPGKTEYRQLKMLRDHPDLKIREMAKALRIYTPGKDDVSPFRFNPFQYPEGITSDEHIAQLLTCFEASMPLGGPLQALLAESIEGVYHERAKRAISEKSRADFPSMTDLVDVARRIMEGKGYAGEVRSNLSAAIEVRLSSLTRLGPGKIFQCRQSLPSIKDILKYPTIIEIQNLNAYQGCLLILFLLSAIWEEIRISRRYSRGLKHLVVIEEAHNIVGKTGQAKPSEEFADPKAYAAEYVVRMLAEIRAIGEGIIIADQLPSAVSSSVIKNTGTKLAHRLVSLIDRKELGGAMLLQDSQTEEIARLEPGQAYYYTEGLYSPLQIAGLNAYGFLGLEKQEAPDSRKLLSVIKEEDWFKELKKGRYSYIFEMLLENCKKLEETVNQNSGHLEIYLESYGRIKEVKEGKAKIDDNILGLRSDVIKTREGLRNLWVGFADFVNSMPEDFKEYLSESEQNKYKKLVDGPIRKMKDQIIAIDKGLEDLRAEISRMI